MKTKTILSSFVLAMFACACSKEYMLETQTESDGCNIVLNISTDSWRGENTRTSELLTPVTALIVPKGDSEAINRVTSETAEITLSIPSGEYEIYVICGLPDEKVPNNVLESFDIPVSENGLGLSDFAVGLASITNEYGKLSSPVESIAAKRQMAWLSLKVSDIPENLTLYNVSIKHLGNSYNISDGWATDANLKNKFTKFFFGSKDENNTVSKDLIFVPCTDDKNGTEFRIVATTTTGKTLTYSYISTAPMIAGTHLTLNLSISDMALVNETIDVSDWDDKTENGTLVNPTVE